MLFIKQHILNTMSNHGKDFDEYIRSLEGLSYNEIVSQTIELIKSIPDPVSKRLYAQSLKNLLEDKLKEPTKT